jgi:hypothetical protein
MAFTGAPAVSLAAAGSSGNLLAGNPFEFIGRAAVRLAVVSSATPGVTYSVLNGTEIIAQDVPAQYGGGAAVIQIKSQDDYHVRWLARGRQQLIVKNPTGGAITYTWQMEIVPV